MLPGGLTVLNQIPRAAIRGLLTKELVLDGGVIRWAAGTGRGGQIFMHLLPAGKSLLNLIPGLDFLPGIVANVQLYKVNKKLDIVAQATQQILGLATGTAILSGLSLAVSCIGFKMVNEKLTRIDKKLDEIKNEVKAIRDFLETAEQAKLFTALEDLLRIEKFGDSKTRHDILIHARKELGQINHKYKQMLPYATSVNTAMAYEEYFSLTALARARCSAELGQFHIACEEIEELHAVWQVQARRIAKDLLIGEYPERFLASDFAEDVSISDLITWLDFISEEEKGYTWVDELRRKINENWYKKGFRSKDTSGLNKGIGVGLEQEKKVVIPTLQKIIARDSVFQGYRAQYHFFQEQQIQPSIFQEQIIQLPENCAVDGYYLLKPSKTA